MSVIFFDNDINHIENMKENIKNCTVIHVPDTTPNPRIESLISLNNQSEYTRLYRDSFPKENTYLKIVRKLKPVESRLPTLGITEDHIKELHKWVDTTEGKKIAIFDWDRTLTVVESIILPPDLYWKSYQFSHFGYNTEDLLLFVMGGPVRLQMIRDMFSYLYANNVDVFVNTRSVAARDMRNAFLVLLKSLTNNKFQDANLICAHDVSKSNAQKGSQSFQSIAPQGGGRRTRRSHTKKRKGMTRRHKKRN